MATAAMHVKKYTCDCCHYFFYVDADEEYPSLCPYCSCEVVPMEMVDWEFAAIRP